MPDAAEPGGEESGGGEGAGGGGRAEGQPGSEWSIGRGEGWGGGMEDAVPLHATAWGQGAKAAPGGGGALAGAATASPLPEEQQPFPRRMGLPVCDFYVNTGAAGWGWEGP